MQPRADRRLPDHIEGYGDVRAYAGQCVVPRSVERAPQRVWPSPIGREKRLRNVQAAIEACEIKDGAVISFHHHLRNGDGVLNLVLDVISRRGIKDLTLAASSIFPVHTPLIDHIRNGVVSQVVTAYMSGPVADFISAGGLQKPAIMQTHGGRARAIQSGELRIDVAFIAAPSADSSGNVSGAVGPAACGPLGYAMVDAEFADRVVALTDNLVAYPVCPIDIHQDKVDFIVRVDSIGDPRGILSGTTRPTEDPVGRQIAKTAAQVIEASGLLGADFSFQTGAGGISLAVAQQLSDVMHRLKIQGAFAAGGVTGYLCDMLEMGLFRSLFDVQCFDLKAVESYLKDPRHMAMSASLYSNPHTRGAVVDRLDTMILGAAEIDLDFNVNVTTGSSGKILGGSGGHADTADGAKLAIVTTKLSSAAGPKIVDRVGCITTPGASIDVLVTEAGVAVNRGRSELRDRLLRSGLPVRSVDELRQAAGEPTTRRPADALGRCVAVVEYRDGSVIDVVRQTPVHC